jgi:uncharacterized membrane protein (UPF0127 family)
MSSRLIAPAWLAAGVAVAVLVAGCRSSGETEQVANGECGGATTKLDGVLFGEASIDIDGATQCVLLAETASQKAHGLMNVRDLGSHAGMLFVFDSDTDVRFYMKDTLIPLSIAWFRADGTFVSSADMEPCPPTTSDCPTFGATGRYRYALEVPKGDLVNLGIHRGTRVKLARR